MNPVLKIEDLLNAQEEAQRVRVSDPLLEYVLDLVWASRRSERLVMGISPRGAEAVVTAAKAWAYLDGRDYCLPEDVQAIAPSVMRHRLVPGGEYSTLRREQVVEELLRSVPIP